MKKTVSFARDIAPIFAQFRASMTWRLDLTNYDSVKANADMVWSQISTQQMPPAPYPPLTKAQLALFHTWMKEDFPA
ncbi:hypothetical protein V8J88_00320 [Massilia sp. W12]|uniref:hypothetical protein n=1 Tax=Massilia sp. W12 TaxID=3126507 RepID=UPI0030D554A3